MVVARQNAEIIKILLPSRFQEAIDEAAMRKGDIDADAYTNGWIRDAWINSDKDPQDLADTIALELEEKFTDAHLLDLLNSLGKS